MGGHGFAVLRPICQDQEDQADDRAEIRHCQGERKGDHQKFGYGLANAEGKDGRD